MFLAIFNHVDRNKHEDAVGILLRLSAFDLSFKQKDRLHLAWGAAAENINLWQDRDQGLPYFRRLVQSLVRSRRVVLGAFSPIFSQQNAFSTANSMFSVAFGESAVVSTQRLSAKTVWFGWYREDGINLVLAHSNRRAIEAATGTCGCLFDERLQLWLVPKSTSVIYEVGATSILTAKVDHGSR